MKTIFVTGCDGYTGWPIFLKLLKELPNCFIVGADNLCRRRWVKECNAKSFLKIRSLKNRIQNLKKIYNNRFSIYNVDLRKYENVNSIIKDYKPDIILHLASQPSAPYSHISAQHCSYTQTNNITMLTNIMFSLNENKLNNSHLVVTTTTGIYGAPDYDLPEGNIIMNKMELPHPPMGGSWYHMSRSFDVGNLWLGSKQFNFPISEMRTSIVTGSSTEETREIKGFETRFDIDFYFGVVTNRFAIQALKQEPITIYGQGLQQKPMISLTDMVRSMVEICKKEPKSKYTIYNQLEKPISIVDLANTIKKSFETKFNHEVEVVHIPNPRIENEEYQMVMYNEKFLELNGGISETIEESILQICIDISPFIKQT